MPHGVAFVRARAPAGAWRCLCTATQQPILCRASSVAALFFAGRRLSTGEEVPEREHQWSRDMATKYGTGNYQLFRPLYKDLCDEMRREFYTKPPPPPSTITRSRRGARTGTIEAATTASSSTSSSGKAAAIAEEAPHVQDERTAKVQDDDSREATADGKNTEAEKGATTTATTSTPSLPEASYGDGSWSVQYRPEDNLVTFRRAPVKESRLAEVVAWSRVELKDPPRLNAVLTFADWIPIEVCVVRNGVILHFSMASNEGGMHMRNVRVYSPTSQAEKAALLDPTVDGEYARKKLYYDGPCLWHLELDFQNELYDVMQDHGVTLDWVHWAATWVFYLEHVDYVRWNLGMLEELIPSPWRGPEDDFLLPAEMALLEEPVEDWMDAHSI